MTVEQEVRQLMYDAADAIDRYGWKTGDYGNEGLGFCAVGALRHAANCSYSAMLKGGAVPAAYHMATHTLANWLVAEGECRFSTLESGLKIAAEDTIVRWNDAFGDMPTGVPRECPCGCARSIVPTERVPLRSQTQVSTSLRKAADTITLEG